MGSVAEHAFEVRDQFVVQVRVFRELPIYEGVAVGTGRVGVNGDARYGDFARREIALNDLQRRVRVLSNGVDYLGDAMLFVMGHDCNVEEN